MISFHLASELTSWWEFKYFYEGILEHKKAYNIESEKNPAMKFFYIHTLVETEHLAQSEDILNAFVQMDSNALNDIYDGIELYMKSYHDLFSSLNVRIY